MSGTHDELRDHLVAVMEAAQELPKEDRAYLADSFLTELERQYQLVSRSQPGAGVDGGPDRPHLRIPSFNWWMAPFFALPVLLLLFAVIHPPILILALILFMVFRFGRPGMRGRGDWKHGPRGRDMRRYVP